MSRKFLTPVGLPSGTVNPTGGSHGEMFYRTDLGLIVLHDGATWNPIQATGGSNPPVSGGSPGGYVDTLDGGVPSTTVFSTIFDGGNESSF